MLHSQRYYFFSRAGSGLLGWDALCAVLFWLAAAMIVLCYTFVPIFHRLKVYTAYEFLSSGSI